ncbi:unnamed protein product [Ophioblennius macclurei]
MASQAERGVPLSTLSPKFLHSNSTSHTWPFSAIAELIDNAYDPDVRAKQFWIDKTVVKGEECLRFMDNGNGLDNQTMHKMLSFGYSDKSAVNGLEPIGIYGNGFKSGSMRLGKDAIVFSKSAKSSCVGMLSQTYLQKINANQIIVPIVSFEERGKNGRFVPEEHRASLKDILEYSPFGTQTELLTEIEAITQLSSKTKTGTRIIIWNLRKTSSGSSEFDFDTDRYDIRIPSEVYETLNNDAQKTYNAMSHTPECVFSLRAYCSILYKKPRMQINVRGMKVKSQLIDKSLAWRRKDIYKPAFLNSTPIPITFGYNTKSKDQYGIMMYHKNRLIKAYERVGCQLKANNKGVGVIGVIECNFLEPTHNKQNFLESDKYRKTMISLGNKLEEYWKEMSFRKKKENPQSTVPVEDTIKRPDQNWVQCDECSRWRKLPDGIDCTNLPDKWFCHMNPDPQFKSCEIEEEPEDSDDDQTPYRKTYREQEREEQRKQMKKHSEEQRLAELSKTTEALQKRREAVRQSLRELATSKPSTPRTPSSTRRQNGALSSESSPQSFSTISQAACSPSSSFPIITDVRSLSAEAQGAKRKFPFAPTTPTAPRTNGLQRRILNPPVDVSSANSPDVPIVADDDDDEDTDDTDDDLFILENASTPKPKKTGLGNKKVKLEKEEGDGEISMVLECSDDAAVDHASAVEVADSATTSAMTSATTQTEIPKLKQENASQPTTDAASGETQTAGTGVTEQRSDSGSQREFKQESQESQGAQESHNGAESGEQAGPSNANANTLRPDPARFQNITEIAKERESLKKLVDQLTRQLEVKKECSHQESQTDDSVEKSYKVLFEKAKKKVDELIELRQSEALKLAAESRTAKDGPKEADEMALQIDALFCQLDQTNQERDELRSQVESLTEEKARLAAECEELRLRLQQQSEEAPTTSSSSSVHPHPDEERQSDAFRSLIQLRHNIGRYLVPHVPALDLDQVNFECTVIDEILEQVLSSP